MGFALDCCNQHVHTAVMKQGILVPLPTCLILSPETHPYCVVHKVTTFVLRVLEVKFFHP